MKLLLDAFSGLVIALRFGSDSYAHGDMVKAEAVFSDALRLFSATKNQRGLGIAHNNLGAVRMNQGMLAEAEQDYIAAVENAREMMNAARSEEHTSELQSLMRLSYADFCLK